MNLSIVCINVGTRYPMDYVTRLKCMVNRWISYPHTFYCVTDRSLPSGNGIHLLDPVEGLEGWWQKLGLFAPNPYGLEGRILYLDLDVVITGSLEDLLTVDSPLVIAQDFIKTDRFNSSVMLLHSGACPEVWASRYSSNKYYGDQDLIYVAVAKGNAVTWPKDWIVSYRLDCKGLRKVSKNAKVVCFHGQPKPHEVRDDWVVRSWV